jgi:hypothetical protein
MESHRLNGCGGFARGNFHAMEGIIPMWISLVWYSFGHFGITIGPMAVKPYFAKIRTYEEDNCHQPTAYPGLLSDFTALNLDCHGDAVNLMVKDLHQQG